jgi:ATP/maltotriose-dependent transcriptional regulator MalT/DNA-binding SARP family transcriptional activator
VQVVEHDTEMTSLRLAKGAENRRPGSPTPAAKVKSPGLRPPLLRRPSLEQELDQAFGKRLTVVTASAGFGKSTLLTAWVADVEYAWYTLSQADAALDSLAYGITDALRQSLPEVMREFPTVSVIAPSGTDDLAGAEAFAALLCERLHEGLHHDFALVLDDVHEIAAGSAQARLIESLCRQAPRTLHLILSSRAEPPFPVDRLRGQGDVLELTGSMLAFTLDELAELVAALLPGEDASLAEELHGATGGWPAAIRLALDALQRLPAPGRKDALSRLRQPGSELYAYLATEALTQDPAETRELLRRMSLFERFSAELCTALGVPNAAEAIFGLVRRGFAAEVPDGYMSLHGLVRDFVLSTWPLEAVEATALHRQAAEWLAVHGTPEEALRSYAAAGDFDEFARLLSDKGGAMLAAGAAEAVVRSAGLLPVGRRDSSIDQVVGEALTALGKFEQALALFDRAAREAKVLPKALAWRMVKAHYLRDDLGGAVKTYTRSAPASDETSDDALLLAWTAVAQFRRGEIDAARALAEQALSAATACDDPGALAAAHASVAVVLEAGGDLRGSDTHQRAALAAAERAEDVLQICRVRNNRGSLMLAQGLYPEAISELDTAIRLAEVALPSLLALALMNRGLCRWCLGQLDQANADYEAAIAVYRRTGTSEISYALIGRGDVYRERGDLALARVFYEEGLEIAEQSGDRQGLVPGLYQLAKVLVDDEPEKAIQMAERAVSYGWPDLPWALNAVGWIALAHGDGERAAEAAAQSEAAARERGDRFGLAESLELQTFSAVDPSREGRRLEEACELWRELGNPLRVAAAELAHARLSSGIAAQAAAHRAEQKLRLIGVRVSPSGPAGLLRTVARETETPVTVETLGGFRLRRAGETVALADWRSKKARDLFKILISRSRRPTTREHLMEALWPGADPATLRNRLSVALSTVRATLDPDKRFVPDHFVAAEGGSIVLRLDNVAVDLQIFLHEAEFGLSLRAAGRRAEATEHLRAAEATYAGDFLEEDLYEDWAVPVREQARVTYVAVVRALAEDALAEGDREAAIGFQLRLLERDCFDEGAHLGLVATLSAAGRHGEALRRYRLYCGCMEEIGVEAAPFGATSPPA